MTEWKEVKLGEVVEVNTKSINREYPYKDILYLDTGSITEGKIKEYKPYAISEAPSRAKRLVSKNSIVYSNVRPIQRHYGFIKNPEENLVVSTGFTVIDVIKSLADSLFVYYFLVTNETVDMLDIIAEGSTSAYPSIRPDDILSLDLLLPPLSEQQAIAGVLGSLDDKIDLLHRQNKTLEAIAETLFRQWFIEEAKDDWEEVKLGEVLDLKYGKGLTKNKRSGSGYPVIGSNGIVDYHSEYLVKGPGIVIGRKGTLGQTNYINDNFYPIDTTYFIESKKKHSKLLFEFFLLRNLDFGDMNTDTAVPGLNKNLALKIRLKLPPDELVNKFVNIIIPLWDKKQLNTTQIHTLERLRDTLLPKLMSGEVRVVDGDKNNA